MKIAILLVIILLGAGASQQTHNPDSTFAQANGRLWINLTPEQKVTYLYALSDGIVAFYVITKFVENDPATMPQSQQWAQDTQLGEAIDIFHSGSATIGEETQAVDQFYSDSANLRIPISWALSQFTLKVRGATADQLNARLTLARKRIDTYAK